MWSLKEDNLKNGCVKMVNYLIVCYGVLVKTASMKTGQSWRAYSSRSRCAPNGPEGGQTGCQKGHRIMTKIRGPQ
jgi:hypothetical protein